MLDEHGEIIELLREAGADPDELWLVEAQTVEEFAKFYPRRSLTFEIMATSSLKGHDCILYHHESGEVNYFGTFQREDRQGRQEAIEWMAGQLTKR